MFERYTEEARRAIYFARAYAILRNAAAIETSDLSLGVAHEHRDPGSPAGEVHEKLADWCAFFEAQPATRIPDRQPDMPLSNASKKALAYAAMEVDRDRRYALHPIHLLRGIVRNGDATARKLIADGFPLERLRAVPFRAGGPHSGAAEACRAVATLRQAAAGASWTRRLLMGTALHAQPKVKSGATLVGRTWLSPR